MGKAIIFICCLVCLIAVFYTLYRMEKSKLPPEEDIEKQEEDIEDQNTFIEKQ